MNFQGNFLFYPLLRQDSKPSLLDSAEIYDPCLNSCRNLILPSFGVWHKDRKPRDIIFSIKCYKIIQNIKIVTVISLTFSLSHPVRETGERFGLFFLKYGIFIRQSFQRKKIFWALSQKKRDYSSFRRLFHTKTTATTLIAAATVAAPDAVVGAGVVGVVTATEVVCLVGGIAAVVVAVVAGTVVVTTVVGAVVAAVVVLMLPLPEPLPDEEEDEDDPEPDEDPGTVTVRVPSVSDIFEPPSA